MRIKKLFTSFFLIITLAICYGQKSKTNSETRRFIDDADFTQINKNWNLTADFKSGLGEIVSFFPVEAIDLKTGQKVKSLQMDMTVLYQVAGRSYNYFKSSWIDLGEVEEFIIFLEQYVIPNLRDKAEKKQSTTYIFNSKEITFSFHIQQNSRRISIYLKDNGYTDYEHYFWTETQVSKIPDLLNVLKQLK
ncbi:hypothetical protein [Flavobacterium sp.]|uniref:hypothetical protein n=1 Tax=Flavobacterium sp. TaxID=239 RepID=UPI003B9B42B0